MSKELFKGCQPTPKLGTPQDPDQWWRPSPWQPGSPRAFTSQHNFGQTDKVNATTDKRTVSIRKKDK